RHYTRRRKEQYSQKRTARNGCSTKKKDAGRGAEAPMILRTLSARLKSCPPKEKTVKGVQPGVAVLLGTEWLCHEEERCRASRHKSSGLPQNGRKPGATYTSGWALGGQPGMAGPPREAGRQPRMAVPLGTEWLCYEEKMPGFPTEIVGLAQN